MEICASRGDRRIYQRHGSGQIKRKIRKMIHVIATVQARQGKLNHLTVAFLQILPTVQAKKGCQEYSLAKHFLSSLPGQTEIHRAALITRFKIHETEMILVGISLAFISMPTV